MVSCSKSEKLTFDTIRVKQKVLLFPDKEDTIPYADIDFKLVYPKTFEGNKEHLKKLQQIFVVNFLNKEYKNNLPQEAINTYIQKYTKKYRKENAEIYDESLGYMFAHTLTIKDSIVFFNKSVLSFSQDFYEYTGGAHGIHGTYLKSIDLKTLKEIKLADIFKQEKLQQLTNRIRAKLLKMMEEGGGDKSYFFDFEKIENTDNFFITDKGIKFIYNVYEIASYAAGMFEVEIPYNEIEDLLREDFKQRYIAYEYEKVKTTVSLDTSIVEKYIDYAEGKDLQAIYDCSYFTDNLKKAYKEFMQPYEKEGNGLNLDFDPLLCCCGTEGVKVKAIKGDYVLYEGLKDQNLYLNARLVIENDKTLIDGLGMINMPMLKGTLKEELWREVWVCNMNFEEEDASDMRNVIDDARNGYLRVWGEYPTCGCACSSTVGAYKDHYGFYTFLKEYTESCSYMTDIRSNRLLSEVLPEDFGMQTFIPSVDKLPQTDIALFTLNVTIPRKGTDTKVSLKMLPLGLLAPSATPLVYYSEQNEQSKMQVYEVIQQLAKDGKNNDLLNKLLHKNIVDLSVEEQAVITKLRKDTSYGEISVEDLQYHIEKVKLAYTYYSQIEYDSVLLGWDRQKARFFIKEKYDAEQRMSFVEFLQKSKYWIPSC